MKEKIERVPGYLQEAAPFYIDNERRLLRDARTLILSGHINNDSAKDLTQDFEILMNHSNEPITLIINSAGGEAFDGIGIIRAINKAQGKGIKVIGEVHGQAMSMAFMILQCCDKRTMGKYCSLMCHGVSTFAFLADIKDIEAERKIMGKVQHDFASMIAERNTAPGNSDYRKASYWLAILEDNTPQFYDGQEAIEMGLIDKVQ